MRFLGIDYGTKKIGLSISDETAAFAFPKAIIPNTGDSISAIKKICDDEEVSEIVLGESYNYEGQANAVMKNIEAFKENLEKILGLPVWYEREFMTSIEARRQGSEGKSIFNARKTKAPAQGNVDDSAAALILQRYLDRKNKKLEL